MQVKQIAIPNHVAEHVQPKKRGRKKKIGTALEFDDNNTQNTQNRYTLRNRQNKI